MAALARYDILDSVAEPEFDDVVRLASIICRTPIAVVNLVADERQWFKSEVGLNIRETPIEVSLCRIAILEPDLCVVPDLSMDPRFSANPLVQGPPGLRFYAGQPLMAPDGVPFGTLCVLDYVPRPNGLDDEQAVALGALARQVMALLDGRGRWRNAGRPIWRSGRARRSTA
jgi:GAF domain-containing protein